MGAYVLDKSSTIMCMHGGQAQATSPSTKVKVDGNFVVCQPPPHTISGCSFPPQSGGPCVTAMWSTAATKVKAGGMFVLIKDSSATCTPTGTGVQITMTQTKVKAT